MQTQFYLCKTQSPIVELIYLSQFNHKIISQNLFSAHIETFHVNHKKKKKKIWGKSVLRLLDIITQIIYICNFLNKINKQYMHKSDHVP